MRTVQSTFEIDAQIRRVANRQLGLITIAQAVDVGVDRHALTRRRACGALEPVFGEVMRVTTAPVSPSQRSLAAALAVPGSIITATSAAALLQFPIPRGESAPGDEVLSVARGTVIRLKGITAIRRRARPQSKKWFTARVASPAAVLLDLPRFVSADVLERCVDHCLAHRLITVSQFRTSILETPYRAHVGRRVLLDLLEDRSHGIGHRSGMEQRVGQWLKRAGLCAWIPNHQVGVDRGRTIEVDFGWPRVHVALEVSPFFTHGNRVTQQRDATRRRILVRCGWQVVEAMDGDLTNAAALRPTIAALRALGAT